MLYINSFSFICPFVCWSLLQSFLFPFFSTQSKKIKWLRSYKFHKHLWLQESWFLKKKHSFKTFSCVHTSPNKQDCGTVTWVNFHSTYKSKYISKTTHILGHYDWVFTLLSFYRWFGFLNSCSSPWSAFVSLCIPMAPHWCDFCINISIHAVTHWSPPVI